jgi:hypothetical protein
MAWVSSGTVSVTNGSTTVTGTGTSWFGAMQNGWGFVGPDGRVYEILTVDSADTITLKTPYQGSTAAAQAYAVFPTGSHNLDLTAALQQLLSDYQGVYDTVGQGRFPGEVVFDADRDTGMGNPSANELGLKAGDVWQLLLKGGQASGAAVQASLIDATAGKLAKVGAFGWGATGAVDEIADINATNTPSGAWTFTNTTVNKESLPAAFVDAFGIIIVQRSLSNLLTQTSWKNNGDGGVYRRHYSGGSWLPWIQFAEIDANGRMGLGTASPARPLHIYSSNDASSHRMRIENGDGWADLMADATFFKVTTNATGGGDTSFLTYDGINGRLGVNATPNDHLHVHEPTNGPTVLRLSNNEGNVRILQDQFGNLTFNQNGHVAHFFDDYGRIDIYGNNSNNNHKLGVYTENLSFDNNIQRIVADRPGGSGFDFLSCFANDAVSADIEFRFRGDGQAFADGSWSGGGADYAEFFEWSDGNASGEDRRGVSVVLDGAMIRPALSGENPIGVISATPSVIGDADIDRWKEKYLRDAFGSYIMEDFEILEWEVLRPTQDPETGAFSGQFITRQYPADAVPEGIVVPADATRTTLQRRTLNPAWNPDEEYIPRSERPEWATVGLMGKLRLRKGQPTSPNWRFMREINADVEEWLVR